MRACQHCRPHEKLFNLNLFELSVVDDRVAQVVVTSLFCGSLCCGHAVVGKHPNPSSQCSCKNVSMKLSVPYQTDEPAHFHIEFFRTILNIR